MSEITRYTPADPAITGMLDRRTDSWTAIVENVAQLATRIADTELVPKDLRGHPAAVAAVILYGREIGLPPMTALRTSYVVGGRVGLHAETMRGLVLAASHEIVYREASGARCIAAGRRKGTEAWQEVEWNLDMARVAGLYPGDPKSGWARYPRAMLKARATAELCRDLFPDVIGGFEAVEEIEDTSPNGAIAAAPDTTPRRTVRREQPPAGGDDTRTGTREQSRSAVRGNESGGDETARGASVPPASGSAPAPPAGPPLPGEAGYDELGAPEQPADNMPKNIPANATPEPATERRDTGPWPITEPQSKKLHAMLGHIGIRDRELGLAFLSLAAGRPIDTSKELTRAEARGIIDFLTLAESSDELSEQIALIVTDPNPIAALNRFADMFVPAEDEPTGDVDTRDLT